MTLLQVVQELETFNKEDTIYVAAPWTEHSLSRVLREADSGKIPAEAVSLGFEYFLEVFIACEFIQEFEECLEIIPTIKQKCLRLIEYANNDA